MLEKFKFWKSLGPVKKLESRKRQFHTNRELTRTLIKCNLERLALRRVISNLDKKLTNTMQMKSKVCFFNEKNVDIDVEQTSRVVPRNFIKLVSDGEKTGSIVLSKRELKLVCSKHLSRFLHEDLRLRVLKLQGVGLGCLDLGILLEGLKENISLEVLDLSNNLFGNHGVELLTTFFETAQTSRIKELRLRNVLIDDGVLVSTVKLLRAANELRAFYMGHNNGIKQARTVNKILKDGIHIRSGVVELGLNNLRSIDRSTCRYLAHVLHQLEVLDLGANAQVGLQALLVVCSKITPKLKSFKLTVDDHQKHSNRAHTLEETGAKEKKEREVMLRSIFGNLLKVEKLEIFFGARVHLLWGHFCEAVRISERRYRRRSSNNHNFEVGFLRELKVGGPLIGDIALIDLCGAMRELNNLRKFVLTGPTRARIRDVHVVETKNTIESFLKSNYSIREYDLGMLGLGGHENFVKKVTRLFKVRKITSLKLKKFGLTDNSAKHVAGFISTSKNLNDIDLSDNLLGVDSFSKIMAAIAISMSLDWIDLSGNSEIDEVINSNGDRLFGSYSEGCKKEKRVFYNFFKIRSMSSLSHGGISYKVDEDDRKERERKNVRKCVIKVMILEANSNELVLARDLNNLVMGKMDEMEEDRIILERTFKATEKRNAFLRRVIAGKKRELVRVRSKALERASRVNGLIEDLSDGPITPFSPDSPRNKPNFRKEMEELKQQKEIERKEREMKEKKRKKKFVVMTERNLRLMNKTRDKDTPVYMKRPGMEENSRDFNLGLVLSERFRASKGNHRRAKSIQ